MVYRLCIAVLFSGLLYPCLATGNFIVAASLGSASLGLVDARIVGPTLGVGLTNQRNGQGAVLVCRSFETWYAPPPDEFMPALRHSTFSPFLYLTSGLKAGTRPSIPTAYAYVGGNAWSEDATYIQTGMGLRWTSYLNSASLESGVTVSRGFGKTLVWPQLKLTVEFGGWWPIRMR